MPDENRATDLQAPNRFGQCVSLFGDRIAALSQTTERRRYRGGIARCHVFGICIVNDRIDEAVRLRDARDELLVSARNVRIELPEILPLGNPERRSPER